MSSKKLSLEERLSLASKKRKKKSKKLNNLSYTSGSPSLSPVSSFSNVADSSLNQTVQEKNIAAETTNENETNTTKTTSHITNSYAGSNEIPIAVAAGIPNNRHESEQATGNTTTTTSEKELDIYNAWLPANYEEFGITKLLNILTPHILHLNNECITLKKTVNELQVSALPKGDDNPSFIKLIKEKDEIITKLKFNKDTLLKSEQILTGQIKSLNSVVYKYENKIQSQKDELALKVCEFNKLNDSFVQLRNNKTNLITQMKDEHAKALSVISTNNETYVREMKGRHEKSYNLLETKYEAYELKIKELTKNLKIAGDLKSKYEKQSQEILQFEKTIDTLNKTLGEEKEKFIENSKALKVANHVQVTTLEYKVEQLRIELDAIKCDSTKPVENNSAIPELSRNRSNNNISRDQHSLLQEQFEASKANWNSIEYALNNRLAEIEEQLQVAKAEKMKLNEKVKDQIEANLNLEAQLNTKIEKVNEFQFQNSQLHHEISTLKPSIQDLQDDYKLLQKKFDIQRTQLGQKIEYPIPTQDLNSINLQQTISSPSKVNLSINIADNWLNSANADLKSPSEYDISNDGFSPLDDNLRIDVPDIDDLNLNEGVDGDHGLIFNSSYIPDEASDLQIRSLKEVRRSISGNLSGIYRKQSTQMYNSGNQLNSQIVSRLGAELRRMEAEVSSMKDANERLQNEKKKANGEILVLLEENEKVQKSSKEREKLENELKDVERKLEVSLILLGEKTEQVEELQNDVADIKDMMREQLQQMLKLQENQR